MSDHRPVFTGIGSRRTPLHVLNFMHYISKTLGEKGYKLRSGGADGADSAFERGFDEVAPPYQKQIFLPWPNFNGHQSSLCEVGEDAIDLAMMLHPNPGALKPAGVKLHARNCYQVLGKYLSDPSDFVVCWTDGTGGTQQALRIAQWHGVPIYNLFFMTHVQEFTDKYLLENPLKEL